MTIKAIIIKINRFTDLIYYLIELAEQQIINQNLQPAYDPTDELLSQKEAAHLLRKDPRTIRRYVRAGLIRQVIIANMPYYSKHEIYKLKSVPAEF